MKITLLFPPYVEGHTSEYGMPPLGLTYLATYLKRHDKEIDVSIIDAHMEGLESEEIRKRILANDPDIVGLTVLTQMFTTSLKIARIIKEANPRIKIIFGGCHINSTKEETFRYTDDVDYLVYGEGEHTLLELAQGKDLRQIRGLIWRDNGAPRVNPPREFFQNLNELPFPDFELIENFSIDRWNGPFADRRPMISMIATRGCPYRCSFCDIHKTNGSRLRLRSIGNVIDEIERLKRLYGIRYLVFKDSTFVVNKRWVIELCDEMVKRGIDIHWRCNARVDLVDEKLLTSMKKAGCHTISFGVESGSQRILDLLQKQITIDQIKEAFRLTNKLGIDAHASFIIGSPTETKEEALETITLARKINPLFAQFIRGIAYPNTVYFEQGRQRNLIDETWYTKTHMSHSETYLLEPTASGMFKVDFDADAVIKEGYRRFYLRPGFALTAMRKIVQQPSFFFDLAKSGISMLLALR